MHINIDQTWKKFFMSTQNDFPFQREFQKISKISGISWSLLADYDVLPTFIERSFQQIKDVFLQQGFYFYNIKRKCSKRFGSDDHCQLFTDIVLIWNNFPSIMVNSAYIDQGVNILALWFLTSSWKNVYLTSKVSSTVLCQFLKNFISNPDKKRSKPN